MSEERDFDYVVGKLPRKDKDGNDTTGDRIGKGGRHRDDGTYSAVAYDLKVVDEDPTKKAPEPTVIVQREVVEVEKHPTRYEDLPWYQQLIYDGIEQALPNIVDRVVDGAFNLAGRGWNAAVNLVKRKSTEHKATKLFAPKKQTLKVDEVLKSSAAVPPPATSATTPDEFDAAYENYSINMTSEEAQKEFVDAFILRLLSEKKLRKLAHANIVDSAGNITDGQAMIDKLSSPLMLEHINTILKNNPTLLETWQTIALEDILGRELMVDSCYVPIDGQALRKNLISLSV